MKICAICLLMKRNRAIWIIRKFFISKGEFVVKKLVLPVITTVFHSKGCIFWIFLSMKRERLKKVISPRRMCV